VVARPAEPAALLDVPRRLMLMRARVGRFAARQ
jgi:hypothetical protein